MKILVIGGSGYFGSKLVPLLLKKGFDITVGDVVSPRTDVNFIKLDLILFEFKKLSKNFDVIIYLSSVSRKISEKNRELSSQINYKAVKKAVDFAVKNRMRFIFASTCSVYETCEGLCDERSQVNPQSVYAKHKLKAEKYIETNMKNYAILRFATMYGLSSNVRFDLLINYLLKNIKDAEITISNHPENELPFIHVKDAAEILGDFITNKTSGVFNVGSDKGNLKIKDIFSNLEREFGKRTLLFDESTKDSRSYEVSFRKLEKLGISTKYDLRDAILEFKTTFFKN
ncbi:MAG: NAD(P)-dependent oxidoreductase [Candidatus Altiarchaeota archaeon]|nr:NAD(P)-dependent oxidoreductase [Candidatus Altiarchaeota archaeon]